MKIKATPTVGIEIPSYLFYGRELLAGIFEYVRTHRRWNFVTGDFRTLTETNQSPIKIDAFIGMFADPEWVRARERQGMPVINVSERVTGIGTVCVLPDNFGAGRAAARYFLEKHYVHFACSGFRGYEFYRLRMDGFQHELRAAGHICERSDLGDSGWDRFSMDRLPDVESWLQALPKPVAIFACTDSHARRLVNSCQKIRIRVPEEVAVMGADNDEIECELSPTPISSVSFPLRRLGYEAASIAEGLIDGGKPPAPMVRLPPTGVVSRRSTDITAIRDPIVARAVNFISAHATDGIDVGAVVTASGASRRYIERRFLAVLGRTPKQEILRVRILKVKRLLAETNMTMPEIAGSCGFTDSKMLSTVFMRETGEVPSQYRKKLKAEAHVLELSAAPVKAARRKTDNK